MKLPRSNFISFWNNIQIHGQCCILWCNVRVCLFPFKFTSQFIRMDISQDWVPVHKLFIRHVNELGLFISFAQMNKSLVRGRCWNTAELLSTWASQLEYGRVIEYVGITTCLYVSRHNSFSERTTASGSVQQLQGAYNSFSEGLASQHSKK